MRLLAWILLLSVMLSSDPLLAGLYKHVDKDGTVTYTDKPASAKQEEFQPPEISNIETPPAPAPGTVFKRRESAAHKTRYEAVTLIDPKHNSTIRDAQGKVTLQFSLTPPLDQAAGHKLVIFMDAKELVSLDQSTSHTLSNVDRGTHVVYGEIHDPKGRVVTRGKQSSFHMKRQSAR